MHTLKNSTSRKDKWCVTFENDTVSRIIKDLLTFDEAIKLVNYLNGGIGQPIGQPIDVHSYAKTY